ncbi:MAG TPA: PfkB family carbohydrate kinase, partial [Aggregatilineales bacterium]|nr:PfkB family carbohydrate kinase [Aggregatilineales bacterium]
EEILRASLDARPFAIKVNGHEIGAILGETIDEPEAAIHAAKRLREKGIQTVVVTLGKLGAVLADGSGCWHAQPPNVRVVDAVGSGDSFLAGLVTAPAGDSAQALRRAAAAGAANTQSLGSGSFTVAEFEAALAETRVRPLG